MTVVGSPTFEDAAKGSEEDEEEEEAFEVVTGAVDGTISVYNGAVRHIHIIFRMWSFL